MTVISTRGSDTIPLPPGADAETEAIVSGLYTDGIIARQGAFTRDWAHRIRDDIEVAFAEARSRENGAVGRGPHRY